jgi:hypothetical protein
MSNIHRISLCVICFFGSILLSYGQDLLSTYNISSDYSKIVPSSPEVSAFAKFAITPVELYTGKPNVSIIIYKVSSGSHTLPVSLNYHYSSLTSSIDPRSEIIGWILSAGRLISRGDIFTEYLDYHIKYPPVCIKRSIFSDSFASNFILEVGKCDSYSELDEYKLNLADYYEIFILNQFDNIAKVPFQPSRTINLIEGKKADSKFLDLKV